MVSLTLKLIMHNVRKYGGIKNSIVPCETALFGLHSVFRYF